MLKQSVLLVNVELPIILATEVEGGVESPQMYADVPFSIETLARLLNVAPVLSTGIMAYDEQNPSGIEQ